MGRELRRKEAKKSGKNLKEETVSQQTNWKKIVLTIGVVLLVLVILYFILAIFVTKDMDSSSESGNDTTVDSASNVANPILANAIFKQSEEVYYVYCYDFSDSDPNVGNTISSNLVDEKVYRVNTSDSMNSKYVSDNGNKNASKLEDLSIAKNTLIRIENDEITLYLNGSNEILSYYNE